MTFRLTGGAASLQPAACMACPLPAGGQYYYQSRIAFANLESGGRYRLGSLSIGIGRAVAWKYL